MTTVNCNTLNASVEVNTLDLNSTGEATLNIVNATDLTSGTITATVLNSGDTFVEDLQASGNITVPAGSISAININATNISITNFTSSNIVCDTLTPLSGTVISCPNEINALYLSANNSVVSDLLLPRTGPTITMNGNVTVTGGIDITGIGNFQNDIDLNNANIANVTNLDVTTMSANNGANITLNGPLTLIADNVDSQFASIHYNSLSGASALRGHSISGITYNDSTVNDNGDLISTNGLSGASKNLSSLVNYGYSLGPNVVASNLVITTSGAFTVMSGFGTFYGRNWTKTSNLILTYTGNIAQTCFITASVSVQGTNVLIDEIDACVVLNPVINGSNEITSSTDLIQVGRASISSAGYSCISGSLVFQFVVNPNDTVCFALSNNTAIRNIDYIYNNFTIKMESNGTDS